MRPAKIQQCDAEECVYNIGNRCHALAITVGGEGDHMCDTFCCGRTKGGSPSAVGMIGACKSTQCKFNEDFECCADMVQVGHWGKEIDCLSYQSR